MTAKFSEDCDDHLVFVRRGPHPHHLSVRAAAHCCPQAQGKRRLADTAWRRGRSPPAPAPDPIDIFFNSMCQSTKRFPYPAQIKVKRALFEAVMAGEEALLAEQQSYASLWARAASASSSDDAGAGAS